MAHKYVTRFNIGCKEHECVLFKFKISIGHYLPPRSSFHIKCMRNARKQNHMCDFV